MRIGAGGQGECPAKLTRVPPLRESGDYLGGQSKASLSDEVALVEDGSVRLKKPGRPGERKLHGDKTTVRAGHGTVLPCQIEESESQVLASFSALQ